MRAAIYLRVSSDKQARAGSIESQRRDVPALCERNGWRVMRTYVDDGASAATGNMANRPGLLSLLADAEARAFDVLAVYDLDRLTRADMLERSLILGTLQRAGVQVATVTGGILDLGSIAGELTAMVQSRGAADWLEKHKARIKAGKLTAIERGRKPSAEAAAREVARCRRDLARIQRAEETLVARVAHITPDVLDRQLARIRTARAEADRALAAAESRARAGRLAVAATASLDETIAQIRASVERADRPERRRELSRLLLDTVEIGDRSVWASIHLPPAVLGLVSGPSYRNHSPNTVRIRQRITPAEGRRAA